MRFWILFSPSTDFFTIGFTPFMGKSAWEFSDISYKSILKDFWCIQTENSSSSRRATLAKITYLESGVFRQYFVPSQGWKVFFKKNLLKENLFSVKMFFEDNSLCTLICTLIVYFESTDSVELCVYSRIDRKVGSQVKFPASSWLLKIPKLFASESSTQDLEFQKQFDSHLYKFPFVSIS